MDLKKSDENKSLVESIESAMKEKEISDQKSQDKEKSEQKIDETGETGAEKATKTDDFNASLDILTAFMKDTENLLQDEKEKKEGTYKYIRRCF